MFQTGFTAEMWGTLAGIVALVAGFVIASLVAGRQVRAQRIAEAARLADAEVATIVERSELTGWGQFWTAIFIATTLGSIAAGATGTTVFQQIASLISWIATLIVFGLAFLTCRRRTYTVYRSQG